MVRVGRPRASILLLLALTTVLSGTAGPAEGRVPQPLAGVVQGREHHYRSACGLSISFDGRMPAGPATVTALLGVGEAIYACDSAPYVLLMHATTPRHYVDWKCSGSWRTYFRCRTLGSYGSFAFKLHVMDVSKDSTDEEFIGVYSAYT